MLLNYREVLVCETESRSLKVINIKKLEPPIKIDNGHGNDISTICK